LGQEKSRCRGSANKSNASDILGDIRGTFYRWKSKYGGIAVSDAKRLRALEEENRRLKRIVADQALHTQMLWCHRHGVQQQFIQPGKPTQNCHVECFNGRFQDECLAEKPIDPGDRLPMLGSEIIW